MIYPATDQYIDLAKTTLGNGEVIVYPTDTLYGFGVDATNTDAIQRLNRLKGRSKPLSIILESVEHLHDFAEFDAPDAAVVAVVEAVAAALGQESHGAALLGKVGPEGYALLRVV